MSVSLSLLLAAMSIALMGAGHCATMCGPTTIAIAVRGAKPRFAPWAHAGRITTYALLGALIAALSTSLTQVLRNQVLQTAWFILPNLFVLWGALYLLGVRGVYAPLERGGRTLFTRAEQMGQRFAPTGGWLGDYVRGLTWGLLPCPLVYSALSIAVLASDPLGGALVMAAFGSATLPVLLGIGLISRSGLARLQSPLVRKALAFVLLATVVWNLYLLPERLNGVKFSFIC
jgi:sulfite exporter TauE/SafE